MIAYQFDSAGVYQGETVADESPLEPGMFLLPARCTFTAPPAYVPDDKLPRWNGAEWTLVNKPAAPIDEPIDPITKLREFLNQNPDVQELLNQGGV